jgi:hypothetical protein
MEYANYRNIDGSNEEYIEANSINIFIPMKIKKRGGAAMVILPHIAALQKSSEKPNYDHKLINAFAKAYKWQKNIDSGSIGLNKIMEREKVGITYASRILRLNLIAPDIIKAIVEGKQPRSLRLEDFMRKPISDLWQEQRATFGFID